MTDDPDHSKEDLKIGDVNVLVHIAVEVVDHIPDLSHILLENILDPPERGLEV